MIFLVPALIEGSNNLSPSNNASSFTSAMQSNVSPHVMVYSSCGSSKDILLVPLNSSGIDVFPLWQIYFFGTGHFKLTVNNSVVNSGNSVGSFQISYNWIGEQGNRTSAVLQFDSVNYSFNDILSGPLNNQVLHSVVVTSTLKGQNQVLSAQANKSGLLMYPAWKVDFESTQKLNYSIFLNGKEIYSGSSIGSRNISFNVSGSSISVQVILGTHTYSYPNELISSIPIQKYYGPKPPAALYTYYQYETALVKGFVAALFGVAIAMFSGRRYILEKEKREAIFV